MNITQAEVFKCKTESDKITFSDKPCPTSQTQEIVKLSGDSNLYQKIIDDEAKSNQLGSKKAVNAYVKYLNKDSEKAFAVTTTGAYGYSTNKLTTDKAISNAMIGCKKHEKDWKPECRIIDINGTFIYPENDEATTP